MDILENRRMRIRRVKMRGGKKLEEEDIFIEAMVERLEAF